jgi:hypothetical protein
VISAKWFHRIHPPELLLPVYLPNRSSSSSPRRPPVPRAVKGQRQRVAVIGRGLAALLHVGLALQHQQIAPVDVVARARQVGGHLMLSVSRRVAVSVETKINQGN